MTLNPLEATLHGLTLFGNPDRDPPLPIPSKVRKVLDAFWDPCLRFDFQFLEIGLEGNVLGLSQCEGGNKTRTYQIRRLTYRTHNDTIAHYNTDTDSLVIYPWQFGRLPLCLREYYGRELMHWHQEVVSLPLPNATAIWQYTR